MKVNDLHIIGNMHVSRIVTNLLLLFVTASSCVQAIEIDVPQDGIGQVVLTGVLEVNDSLTDVLRVTETRPSTAVAGKAPAVASVVFYQQGQWVSDGSIDSMGYINVPDNYPLAGTDYEVTIRLADGRTVSCSGTAPVPVAIANTEWIRDGTQSRHGDAVPSFVVDIDDPPGSEEYYEMAFPVVRSNPPNRDSLYIAAYRYDLFRPNEVMANEGDQDFNPKSLFFSDELFDGTTYHFAQLFGGSDTGGSFGTQGQHGITEPGTYLLFRSTDRAYYEFLKSWARHRYTRELIEDYLEAGPTFERIQDLLFAPQATPLTSNVTGGLGVVGAVHTQVVWTQ
jgi:hypothetical protein